MDSLSARSARVEFCSPCKTIKKAAGSVHTAALIKIGKFKGFKGWKEEVTTLITLMFQICSNHQGLIQAVFFYSFYTFAAFRIPDIFLLPV